MKISRRRLADHIKTLHQKACCTCSTIVFPHSTNQIIDLWRFFWRCRREIFNSLIRMRGRSNNHKIVTISQMFLFKERFNTLVFPSLLLELPIITWVQHMICHKQETRRGSLAVDRKLKGSLSKLARRRKQLNVIWKCNFAFLQSFFNYSKLLCSKNVLKLSWN